MSELVWERPEPPARPAPSPLSREAIVAAACELADADGLDAVSLRKVAAALGAGPMRLYGYLDTKEELLDLMADAMYGELDRPAPDDDWRTAMRGVARSLRHTAHRHEWFADLIGGRPNLGPNALAYMEATLAALGDFGSLEAAMQAMHTVNSYVIGAVRDEVTGRRVERASGQDEGQWLQASGPYLERVFATGRYPTLERVVRETVHPDRDTEFETGLEQVLNGVAPR